MSINPQSALCHVLSDLFHGFFALAIGVTMVVWNPGNVEGNKIDGGASILLGLILLFGTGVLVRNFINARAAYLKQEERKL